MDLGTNKKNSSMKWLSLLACLLIGVPVQSQVCRDAPVEVWRCTEISLDAALVPDHPVRDITLRATFTHASGDTLAISGFWDGGRVWRLRPAFPRSGRWTWAARSSDAGLDGRTGQVDVVAATGADPYRRHGWPRVSADERSLTYADGTPLFYLADTIWEAGWASTLDEFDQYVSERAAGHFNALHVVVNTHQFDYPEHITNRMGQPYLLEEDRSRPNPRYFDYLDALIDRANRAGMLVALVPIWGTYASVHAATSNHSPDRLYSQEDAVLQAQYIGSRYAGSNVIWIIGGDQQYDTAEKQIYWNAFARQLRSSSGARHLMTVHPGGFSGSYDSWPVPPEWLDFHIYQAGHFGAPDYYTTGGQWLEDEWGSPRAGNGGYAWAGALKGYYQNVHIPVLNGEANYEDLFARFWEFIADTTGAIRITDVDVRQTAYWGLLSGSTMGFAYGANGVWQWARPDELGGGFWVNYPVLEAIHLPGASYMARMRDLAEANDWYEWAPRPDLADELDSPQYVAAALGRDRLVAYLPVGTTRFALTVPDTFGEHLRLTWWGTTSEARVEADTTVGTGTLELMPPDSSDWLLVVQRGQDTTTAPPPQPPAPPQPAPQPAPPRLRHAGRNPSVGPVSLVASVTELRTGRLDVVDALGRQVYAAEVALGVGDTVIRLPSLASGLYLGRLTTTGPSGRPETVALRFMVTR